MSPEEIKSIKLCFENIAVKLDNKRLFKQALEGWQILMNLLSVDPQGNYREPKGWSSHPAVKMWKGSEVFLYMYIVEMDDEWRRRGFKSTIKEKAFNTMTRAGRTQAGYETPSWMLDQDMFEAIASSHRLALLSKNYEHYNQFNWPEDTGVAPENYTYVWPIKGGKYDYPQGPKDVRETSNQSGMESIAV